MSNEFLVLLITAVAALLAAGAAWMAALQTRKSSLGQLLSQLVSNYGSTEMLNSLRNLREFKQNTRFIFAKKLARNQFEGRMTKRDNEVNEARRMVFTFYETLRILEKRKILTFEKDISEITGKYGVKILFEIVEPMEYQIAKIEGQKYSKKTFDKFRDWYPKLSDKYPTPPA